MGRRAIVRSERKEEMLSLSIGKVTASFFEEWKLYRVTKVEGGTVVFQKLEDKT